MQVRPDVLRFDVRQGSEPGVARQVAEQVMAKDALGAHARDELGISEITTAPVQAALASAATFSVGAAAPLARSHWSLRRAGESPAVSVGSLVFLALLGMIGAKAGGANILKPTIRVTFWGALAMGSDGRNRCHLWRCHLIGIFGTPFLDNSVSFSTSAAMKLVRVRGSVLLLGRSRT
jgi:hypothetical protein